MVRINDLSNNLEDILKRDKDASLTVIKGSWGIGKTKYWKKFRTDILWDKKIYNRDEIAYISLFGKNSLAEIKTEILIQISSKNKFISESKGFFKGLASKFKLGEDVNFGITGSMFNSLLTVFSKNTFKKAIICFDDLERKSENITTNDLMGLFTEFRDELECKVILLMNEDEISEKEFFNQKKEKVVDNEYSYLPSMTYLCDLIVPSDYKYKENIKVVLVEKEIYNLRVIKKIYKLTKYIEKNIIDKFDITNKELINNTLDNSLRISLVYFVFGFSEFEKLETHCHQAANDVEDIKDEEKEEFEKILTFLNISLKYKYSFVRNTLEKEIIKYIFTGYINVDKLKEYFNTEKVSNDNINDILRIHKLYQEYLYNLSLNKKKFICDLFELIESKKNIIFKLIEFDELLKYINLLIKIDNINEIKYKLFVEESILNHFKSITKAEIFYNFEDEDIKKLIEYNDKTKAEYDSIKDSSINKFYLKKEDILEQVGYIRENIGYGNEQTDKLNSIPVLIHKKFIENQEYLTKMLNFVKREKRVTNGSFNKLYENFIQALTELEDETVDSFKKSRINMILKHLSEDT